jgi:hypothetical protein
MRTIIMAIAGMAILGGAAIGPVLIDEAHVLSGPEFALGREALTILLPVVALIVAVAGGVFGYHYARTVDAPPTNPESSADRPAIVRPAPIFGLAIAASGVMMIQAVRVGQLPALQGAMVLLLGTLTLVAGGYVLEDLARGKSISVDSNWGGLGGGLGGWRLSPTTTTLLITLTFLGATMAAGLNVEEKDLHNQVNANETGDTGEAKVEERPAELTQAADGQNAVVVAPGGEVADPENAPKADGR